MWMICAVLVGVPAVRVVLDHVVADADDHVGPIEAAGTTSRACRPTAPSQSGCENGITPLAMKVLATGNVQFLGEADQAARRRRRESRRCRPGSTDIAAAEMISAACWIRSRRRQRLQGMLHRQRHLASTSILAMFSGKSMIAHAGLLGLGLLERLADHLGVVSGSTTWMQYFEIGRKRFTRSRC